jgi:glycosyltransferase involved in cell wall biosynthesis
MNISVIVPTYNRKDLLMKSLERYGRQRFPVDELEVVVVDDGSSDGTGRAVMEAQKTAEYSLKYFRKENAGPGSARNLGIRKASGKILLIIGDDIFPEENLLSEHWKWHTERFPDANIGVLGFVTWASDPPPTPLMEWLDRGVQNAYHLLGHGDAVSWKHSYTGNMSLKRVFIEETAEMFDERLPPYGYEDIEWGYRLMKKGYVLVYNREAVGRHHHWLTIDDSFHRMERIGESLNSLRDLNPEIFTAIVEDIYSGKGWRRSLLSAVLRPFFARHFILPLARHYERRKINSAIFALSHLYYLQCGFRKSTGN